MGFIKGICHFGLSVADLDESIRFYMEVLGLEMSERRERDAFFRIGEEDVLTLIQEAGIIYLGGEDALTLVTNLHESLALRQIVESYSTLQGLTLIGAGAGAAALGRWVFTPEPPYEQAMGLGFVMNAVVVPHFTTTDDSPILRALPQIGHNLLGLGIPDKTALALGPREQLEMWGEGQITAVVNAGDAAS